MYVQPGIYLYIIIAYLLLGIYKRKKEIIITGSFMMLYMLTCFLGPCALVRYMYVIIVSTPIMISYFFEKNSFNKQKEEIKNEKR